MRNVHFVTGYPGFIGKRLVARLMERDRQAQLYLLVQPRFARDARREIGRLDARKAARVHILVGDIVDMHLGLSGEEYRKLAAEVTHIFHLAAIRYLGVDRRTLERVNVDGTRNVLELAHDAKKLVRLSHMSTVHVAGDRQGVIDEDELEEGQRFHNPYEETKFRAEVLVRKAMVDLPITVFRPSTVVGDSRSGEIDRFDGPYYVAFELVTSPLRVPLTLPGDGSFPLNVVPSDFVVEAVIELAFRKEAAGRTFHLVDPNPMSARKVYEYVARKAGKRPPRARLPAKASVAILRLPFLEKLARPQRAAIEHLNQLVIYNCRNTLEQLDGTGIRCPPLTSYLDKLLAWVEEQQRQRRAARSRGDTAVEDPLAPPTPEPQPDDGDTDEAQGAAAGKTPRPPRPRAAAGTPKTAPRPAGAARTTETTRRAPAAAQPAAATPPAKTTRSAPAAAKSAAGDSAAAKPATARPTARRRSDRRE